MKKILLTTALALATSFSYASELCSVLSETASIVMEKRQDGVSMRQIMEVMDDELFAQVVTEAYEHPAFHTEDMKTKAIQDFENKVYLWCVKTVSK